MKNIMPKKLWQWAIATIIFYVLAWIVVFPVIAGPEFKITFKSEELSEVQIFFVKEGAETFNENDTLTQVPKNTGRWESLRFRLPAESINAFRIDFGECPGEFQIKNIKVYNGLYRKTYSAKEFQEVFNNVYQIKTELNGNKLTLKSDFKDPYMYMSGPFTKASHLLPQWALDIVQLGFTLLSYLASIAAIYLMHLVLKKPEEWIAKNKYVQWLCRDYTGIGLIGIFIGVHYAFSITVSPDSLSFYRYVNILNGNMPLSEWFKTRGFSFPVFLWLSELLFGAGHDGIRSGYLLLALAYIAIFYKLIKEQLPKADDKVIVFSLVIIFIAFDSLQFGYTHLMLTESLAGLIILVTYLVARKWVKYSLFVKGEWLKFIGYGLLLVALSIILWFVKESHWPASIVTIAAVVLGEMLYEKMSWKKIPVQLLAIAGVVVIVFSGMLIWTQFMERVSKPTLSEFAGEKNEQTVKEAEENKKNNINETNSKSKNIFQEENSEDHDLLERTSQQLLNTSLLYGLKDSEIFDFKVRSREWVVENEPQLVETFDEKQAEAVVHTWIDKKDGQRESTYHYLDDEDVSLSDSVIVMLKAIAWRPGKAIKSYAINYAQITNIYRDGQVFMLQAEENDILPYRAYEITSKWENIYHMWNPDFDIPRLHSNEIPNKTLADLFTIGEVKSNLLFSLSFLLSPFIMMLLFIRAILAKTKKKLISKPERVIFVFSTIIFVYAFAITLTGRVHDRYISNVYPLILLQCSLLIVICTNKIKKMRETNEK